MGCNEKDRLLAEYRIAVASYRYAVSEFWRRKGTINSSERKIFGALLRTRARCPVWLGTTLTAISQTMGADCGLEQKADADSLLIGGSHLPEKAPSDAPPTPTATGGRRNSIVGSFTLGNNGTMRLVPET